jgi:menaquinone-dependent protoporphyrinogen IX oxidase
MKTLVAYYSRTGTNKTIAENLAINLGADLDEIVDQKKRSGPIGWLGAGRAAVSHKTTEISTKLDPGDYDTIILGSPIWAGNMNPALRTYLERYDLGGKRVFFFFVSQTNDPSKAVEELRTIVPSGGHGSILSLSTEEDVKENRYEEKVRRFIEAIRSSDTN